MVNPAVPPLDTGDPVPPAVLLDPAGGRFALRGTAVAGYPTVILASPNLNARFAAELRRFEMLRPRFEEIGARVLSISGEIFVTNAGFAASNNLATSILSDAGGRFLSAIGLPVAGDASDATAIACIVIDSDLRLFARLPSHDGVDHAEHALEICREILSTQPHGIVEQQAPVLLVPRVLSPALCQFLIDQWASGNRPDDIATGRHGVDPAAPSAGTAPKPTMQRRSDWLIPDGPLDIELRDIIRRRLVPALRKSFDFQPKAYETLRVGCYDTDRGGYFQRHRDNIGPPEVRRRRFAMSLNLNDDYDGGEVRFPEYGAQRYRPPTGAALVFSCGLLHEALEIRRGRRFVLLTFFFGKEPPPEGA